MKLFKTLDDKFEDIGFRKVKDDKYAATYERYNEEFKYTQVLDILHKASGNHIIQSYDKELFDTKMIGNTNVGLTYYETKLALKKMRKKKWRSK